mgnify:CR=1 FL=1
MIPFGEYLPDQPPHQTDGLVVADGCYPSVNGYRPLGSFAASIDGALPAACLGAASARGADGTVYVFAGTTDELYSFTSSGWGAVGPTPASYSATDLIGWRFGQFGSLVLASNSNDEIQKVSIATPGGVFGDLGGSPPKARYMAIVRDFVCLGYVDGDAKKIANSGINDAESWTPGTDEAFETVFAKGGDITGYVGGEYGLIFQENRITRQTYVSGDLIWQFDEISPEIGCIAPWSIVQVGRQVFFLSEQGFMVCDGNSVTPIAVEKVDRTWRSRAIRSRFHTMSAIADPKSTVVMWAVPDGDTPSGIMGYNWTLQRWFTHSQPVERLVGGMSQGVTLEQLGAAYPNLDTVPASLDDPMWRGGDPAIYLFNGSHAYGSLSGISAEATFRTGVKGSGKRVRGRRLRPITDAGALSVTVYTRDSLAGAETASTYSSIMRGGWMPARFNGGYASFEVKIPAGGQWSFIQGFEEELTSGGRW